MDCMKAQKLIKPYLDKQLSDRELREFLDHVESCRECHDELEIYFSIYESLGDTVDDGDYNFAKKLDMRIAASRAYLRRRKTYRIFRLTAILAAELFFFYTASSVMREQVLDSPKRAAYLETETEPESAGGDGMLIIENISDDETEEYH